MVQPGDVVWLRAERRGLFRGPLIAALAIMLGWAVYRWRTIWIGYAVHAVANTVGIVVLASQLINR
jgi:chromate transport protein ChrA